MEYIDGFTLYDLEEDNSLVPEADWQAIGDEAVHVISLIRKGGVLNRDVNVRHCFMRRDPTTGEWQAVMTDFGLCFFRSQAIDHDQFREWQADQDEEGAIGVVFQARMKGGFKFHRSAYALGLSEEYKAVHDNWEFCKCGTCKEWREDKERQNAEDKAAEEKVAKEKAEPQATIARWTIISLGAVVLLLSYVKLRNMSN